MAEHSHGLYALYSWQDIISYGKKNSGIYVINAPPRGRLLDRGRLIERGV